MPTLQSMDLPRPSNWQDFERLVRDAMMQKWKGSHLTKNGRPGQKQSGVDIFGADDLERLVAIQCKLTAKILSLKKVEKEIEQAEKFDESLTTLYIATTADHDAILQEKIRRISAGRVALGRFSVGLLYWDEIVAALVLNRKVFSSHYPELTFPKKNKKHEGKESMIAALELGYHGGSLTKDLDLIFGEFGEMTQVDPDELASKITIIERRASQLLTPEDTNKLNEALDIISGFIESPAKEKWNHALHAAKRATTRVRDASSLLSGPESNAMNIGIQLKCLYYVDGNLKKEVRQKIRDHIIDILGGKNNKIKIVFQKASECKTAYIWSVKIYNFLNKELRLI